MEEIELVKHANTYIKKLAKGINPLDDKVIDKDEVINQVKISRCLFFVSEILDKYIKNNKSSVDKREFSCTTLDLKDFSYDINGISLSNIVRKINELVQKEDMKKLNVRSVGEWLVDNGYLTIKEKNNYKKKVPTSKGKDLGINEVLRLGDNGYFTYNLYNEKAQKFIVEMIEYIINDININKDGLIEII